MVLTDMGGILRAIAVVLTIVVAVIVFSACGQAVCVACPFDCCVAMDRTTPIRRLAKRLVRTLSRTSAAVSSLARAHPSPLPALRAALTASFAPSLGLAKVSALRI